MITFINHCQCSATSSSTSSSESADGTFHSAAKYFYQLYLIQAWLMRRMFPAVFVLMNRRREKDYDIVCKAIRKAATLHKLHLKPDTIMTDFEIAAIKSLGYNFNAKMKGCLFHFGQSISTKFKKLGFQTLYQLNKGVKLFFRKVFIMALLPPSEVPAYWEE